MALSVLNENETISPVELLEKLNWRYATKKFDPTKKIPSDIWKTLEKALILSPSSFGLQPWKFFVVSDTALRKKLQAASWNQPQIVDASHLVVFAHKKGLNASDVDHFVQSLSDVRKVPLASLDGYKQMMVGFVNKAGSGFDINAWAARQVYIALGTFLTSAALLGIDACPMEGLDPDQYDQILGMTKQGYHTLCVATVGYRAADDQAASLTKVRFDQNDVVVHI
jgi:nitroreductase